MIPETPIQNEVQKLCMIQWDKFKKGEITAKELELECAYIDLNYNFNFYIRVPEPSKPTQLLEYEALDFKARNKVSDGFWRQPEVEQYLKDKSYAERQTMNNRDRLKEIYGLLPKEDVLNRDKVLTKMED